MIKKPNKAIKSHSQIGSIDATGSLLSGFSRGSAGDVFCFFLNVWNRASSTWMLLMAPKWGFAVV